MWRASFPLAFAELAYGEASQLVRVVGAWRSTVIEADGSPEPVWVAQRMLWCAREWLRATGACRERFFVASGWPKCRLCPLYDAEWAAESGVALGTFPGTAQGGWAEIPEIPDHLPEDWEKG